MIDNNKGNASSSWLSFWGGYIGSIISALIAMFILWKQLNQNHDESEKNRQQNHDESEKNRQQNHDESEKNRELQLAILKHGQEKARLSELKKALANYMSSFNYLEIDRVADNMINGKYDQEDYKCLTNLLSDVNEKKTILGMLFPENLEPDFLKKYDFAFDKLYVIYTFTITDVTAFFSFIKNFPKEKSGVSFYVQNWLSLIERHYKDHDIRIEDIEIFPNKKTIVSIVKEKVKEKGDYDHIKENASDILRSFFEGTEKDNSLKSNFGSVVTELLKSEEKRIDDDLYKVINTNE